MAKRGTNRSKREKQEVVTKVITEPAITEVRTEKTYTTTKPEVEIRKPATLAQALTEPAVVVVKPKTKVRKIVGRSIRRAA